MTIIEIKALENGSHNNQTAAYDVVPPEGWAIFPMGPEAENFPFGEIVLDPEADTPTVKKWLPIPIPKPAEPTPAEKRKMAYETDPIIEWNSEKITVDEAEKMFYNYFAEDQTAVCDALKARIKAAKDEIRKRYPDEEA